MRLSHKLPEDSLISYYMTAIAKKHNVTNWDNPIPNDIPTFEPIVMPQTPVCFLNNTKLTIISYFLLFLILI